MKSGNVVGGSAGNGTLDLRALRYVPLVPLIAENVCRQVVRPLDLGNLTKDGMAGLIKAARTDNPQSRFPFKVYAKHHIKGAILDGLLSGTESSRALSCERRRLRNAHQMRLRIRSVEMQEAERGDDFLQSLLGLQRSLQYSENTSDRVKPPRFKAKILSSIR